MAPRTGTAYLKLLRKLLGDILVTEVTEYAGPAPAFSSCEGGHRWELAEDHPCFGKGSDFKNIGTWYKKV